MRKTLDEHLGMELVVSSPEALRAFVAAELERWGRVVRDSNIRAALRFPAGADALQMKPWAAAVVATQ